MPRKKKTPPIELFDLRNRGVDTKLPTEEPPQTDERTPLPIRVQQLIDFLSIENHKAPEEMYCFIMYDIEDNKVRGLVAKYLEKKGCIRVQKSIFFAKLHRKHYQ
jgi:CRISPR-associated protein Cas2